MMKMELHLKSNIFKVIILEHQLKELMDVLALSMNFKKELKVSMRLLERKIIRTILIRPINLSKL
jgi:hypothetical protein